MHLPLIGEKPRTGGGVFQQLTINSGLTSYHKEQPMSPEFERIVINSATVPKTEVAAGTGTSVQKLIPPESAPNFAMRCFTIAPGGGMPNHTNEVEHEQYVLEGTADIAIGGEKFPVMEGDVIFIPAGVPHWYKNSGHSDFKFLCLVPNKPDSITIADE